MLSNTLAIIDKIIRTEFEEIDSKELLDFFSMYEKDRWIYPRVIRRKFNMSTDKVYSLLNEMEKCKLVQKYFELICGRCEKEKEKIRLFKDLPDKFYCENCDIQLNTLENSRFVYKVIRDD